jgi:hypothetical protein
MGVNGIVRHVSILRAPQDIEEDIEEDIFAGITSEDDSGSDWEASRKPSRECRAFCGCKIYIPFFFNFFSFSLKKTSCFFQIKNRENHQRKKSK